MLNKLGVIGGGTAGLLTALGLKSSMRNVEVEIIYSSNIAPIGVGEASTPFLGHFLFNVLEFSLAEFYREVKPTWKLGVRFDWGKAGRESFFYPFGRVQFVSTESGHAIESAASRLMMSQCAPLFRTNGKVNSELEHTKHAFHIDNALFIRYLEKKAKELGVIFRDVKLMNAVTDHETGQLRTVVDDSANSYSYDLYFDCSGFGSLLLGQHLKTPFLPYREKLFADRAMTGVRRHNQEVAPYTFARLMEQGWAWEIPTQTEYHFGYVYSSDFSSDESIIKEFRSTFHTEPGQPLRFQSGRLAKFWVGNVIGIGNSYAFVEPLEATSIHMVIQMILQVSGELHSGSLPGNEKIAELNRLVGEQWDYLRDFLSLHYKYQSRKNSKFWEYCRRESSAGVLGDLVDIYRKQGFLSNLDENARTFLAKSIKDPIFSLRGVDQILFGLGVKPGMSIGLDKPTRELAVSSRLSEALPVVKAMDQVNKHPRLLGFPKTMSDVTI